MKRFVVIDTETTGTSPAYRKDRIIELAAIEIIKNNITANKFQTYLDPDGKESTQEAFNKHKLQDSFLKGKPKFKDIAQNFYYYIKDSTLIFFNRKFDFDFLVCEFKKAGIDTTELEKQKSRCLMIEATERFRLKRNISLVKACKRFDISFEPSKAHSALYDAEKTAELLIAFDDPKIKPLSKTPQDNKHRAPEKFPVPRASNGTQLNYCRNTFCENYGVPIKQPKLVNGKPARGLDDNYEFQSVNTNERKLDFKCKKCGSSSFFINNRAFLTELNRVQSLYSLEIKACPNTGELPTHANEFTDGRRYQSITKKINGKERAFQKLKPVCPNSTLNIFEHPELYQLNGRAKKKDMVNRNKVIFQRPRSRRNKELAAGFLNYNDFDSQKVKCKHCATQFNIKLNPQKGQQNSQVNVQLFITLMRKGIINGLVDTLEIAPKTIYDRITFFHKQCIQFEEYHIQKNLHKLKGKTLNVSMDKMTFYTNWRKGGENKRIGLSNLCSVDNDTRFVLSSTLNLDHTSDDKFIKREARKYKDSGKDNYKRRYAQYVISNDDSSLKPVEDDELATKTPERYLLVHQTYVLLTHLEKLKRFYDTVGHVNLFADNDSGFEGTIPAIYHDLIKQERLTAILLRKSKRVSDEKIKCADIEQFLVNLAPKDNVKSQWYRHYDIIPATQDVDFKLLTPIDTTAYYNASLHGVDNYFQMSHRRINMVERPLPTATNSKKWNGYGAYNPKYVAMLLDIFRVYNNFVLTNEKSITKNRLKKNQTPKTPAQHIGLVDKAFNVQDILEFSVERLAIVRKIKEKSTAKLNIKPEAYNVEPEFVY